ncbi:MAG TPA: hypothetical protein VK589_30140 [Chryseolinea sp.]|nr:hypothetical protein [Chryseolinea sp.]
MAKPEFKYRIEELIQSLPKSKSTDWVAEQLEKEGIKRRTFFHHKAIKIDADEDLSAATLLIYARFFGVTVDDLFNYNVPVKPASERKA